MKNITRFALPALLAAPTFAAAQDIDPVWDFYGQLNLGVISVDNGEDRNTTLTDNDNSNSRVGVSFTQGLANGGEFRLNFETAIGLTGSSSLNGTDDSFDAEYRRNELRKLEIVYKTATIGTFSFGQGSTATDGSAETDFSGTGVAAYSGISDLAGSQSLLLADGTDSGVAIGDAFSAFDGSRRFRVRYDTPTYQGFGIALSAGQEVISSGNDNEYYDFAVKYARTYGDYKFGASLGHSIRDSAEAYTLGSAAIMHNPTGINLAVAAGRARESDASYVYAKAGIQRDWLPYGSTSLSLDYYSGEDFDSLGSDSESLSIAVVQKLDAQNLEIYGVYRTYDFDTASAATQGVDVAFVGARFKF
ncbi:hypothetical protein GGR95_002870 [Sulfitobacter undariae]|uniref:Porin domain-containing protein n=1 Tax=Sulfitobacter undariae TaxID=1563671 RepID=A0A7W6EBM2_9RHOB|nr:porin [Sulfitobacter undariae]MBB3995218.1 hypothetical protein [Sulfitobacter undariae]